MPAPLGANRTRRYVVTSSPTLKARPEVSATIPSSMFVVRRQLRSGCGDEPQDSV